MIDYTSPIGQVRLLIPDTSLLENPRDLRADKTYLFSDDQISAFLAINNGNIKLAAADAIDVVGTDEAMQMLVISTDDKTTDGAKLLNAMLNRGKQLRAQAKQDELDGIEFKLIDPYEYVAGFPWNM